MKKSILFALLFMAFFAGEATAMDFEKDTIPTSIGDLEIAFIGHGSLMFAYKGIVIQVDPFSRPI